MHVGKHIFTGTAGTYYVMSRLAAEGIHASVTHGNAPNVDILVSAADGSRFVAIEVKTTEHALRLRGRGAAKQPDRLEFPLGYRAATLNNPSLVIAFVDLRAFSPERVPQVYLVPSSFVSAYCKPWVDKVKMVRFHIPIEAMNQFKDNWNVIREALSASPALA